MDTMRDTEIVAMKDVDWTVAGDGIRRKVGAYGSLGMAVIVAFEKGAVGVLHRHPHVQITVVRTGSFEVTVGDRTAILAPGDMFYAAPDVLHGVKALDEGELIDFFHPMRTDFVP